MNKNNSYTQVSNGLFVLLPILLSGWELFFKKAKLLPLYFQGSEVRRPLQKFVQGSAFNQRHLPRPPQLLPSVRLYLWYIIGNVFITYSQKKHWPGLRQLILTLESLFQGNEITRTKMFLSVIKSNSLEISSRRFLPILPRHLSNGEVWLWSTS